MKSPHICDDRPIPGAKHTDPPDHQSGDSEPKSDGKGSWAAALVEVPNAFLLL